MAIKHDQERYRFELITENHDVFRFDCGHQVLDAFLYNQALRETQSDLSRTYLLLDSGFTGSDFLAGYLTMCADSLYTRRDEPEGIYLYPLVYIQYLARDCRRRGEGIGSLLLIEALRYAVKVSEVIGIAGVHLDTTLEGRRLYENYGFDQHPDGGNRLLLPISDARAIVAATE